MDTDASEARASRAAERAARDDALGRREQPAQQAAERHSRLEQAPRSSAAHKQVSELTSKAEMARRAAKQQKKWNKRLKIFFCCLGYKKNKDSIGDVASIFAEFYSDLNVPSSDIAAGFVLLSKYQAAQRQWIVSSRAGGSAASERSRAKLESGDAPIEQYLSGVPISERTQFLDLSTARDSHLVNELIYYLNYSLAIFGWPMHLVDDPCLLCCIYPRLRVWPCGARGRKQRWARQQPSGAGAPSVLEDNCCSCNVASARRRLAAHNYEIVYVNYKVDVNVVPFLVAADHSKRSIVVAIRGSMSLSDMVTDMNGQLDRLDGCPEDWLCHRGMLRAASYVKRTLERQRILERALQCRPELASDKYALVLCGHSLGAGAAAILGLLLLERHPTLKAYLYSPPGGILSMPAVEATKQFATGVILGNDTVARLGVAQLERLRYHSLLTIKSAQKSSANILAKALCPSCCFGRNQVHYDPTQSLDLLHGTQGRAFDYCGTTIPFQTQPQVLYVPGRLVHVVKNYTYAASCGGASLPPGASKGRKLINRRPIYQAVWTDNSNYDRILISEGMFLDHLPNKVMHALRMLFCNTLPGRQSAEPSSEPAEPDSQQQQQQCESAADAAAAAKIKVALGCDLNNNDETCEQNDRNNNNNNNDSNNNQQLDSPSLTKRSSNVAQPLIGATAKLEAGELELNQSPAEELGALVATKVSLDENGNERC